MTSTLMRHSTTAAVQSPYMHPADTFHCTESVSGMCDMMHRGLICELDNRLSHVKCIHSTPRDLISFPASPGHKPFRSVQQPHTPRIAGGRLWWGPGWVLHCAACPHPPPALRSHLSQGCAPHHLHVDAAICMLYCATKGVCKLACMPQQEPVVGGAASSHEHLMHTHCAL